MVTLYLVVKLKSLYYLFFSLLRGLPSILWALSAIMSGFVWFTKRDQKQLNAILNICCFRFGLNFQIGVVANLWSKVVTFLDR